MGHVVRIRRAEPVYAMMLRLEQIIDGDPTCCYCDSPAVLGVATGADPETEPACYAHAMQLVSVAVSFAGRLGTNRPA